MRHPNKIALIGFGKIAKDQHLPAIAANRDFELACIIDPNPDSSGVPVFETLDKAVAAGVEITTVVLCTPPSVRPEIVTRALHHEFDIMLEKPPAISLEDADRIAQAVADSNQILFATWHSRFAGMIADARDWLASRRLKRARIVWHEDFQKWHPRQAWLWSESGFGVFDMGINAISILTDIHPAVYDVMDVQLAIPRNVAAPATAQFTLRADNGAHIHANMSFLANEVETWTLELISEENETFLLFDGGNGIRDHRGLSKTLPNTEYERIYEHFAQLIHDRESDVDTQPLAIVEKAMGSGSRTTIDPIVI